MLWIIWGTTTFHDNVRSSIQISRNIAFFNIWISCWIVFKISKRFFSGEIAPWPILLYQALNVYSKQGLIILDFGTFFFASPYLMLGGGNELDPHHFTSLPLPSYNVLFCIMFPQATLEMLKFDVEHGEIEALQQLLPTGILRQVKQLAFELHIWYLGVMGIPMFQTWYMMLIELERQGFRRYRTDINPTNRIRNARTGNRYNGCCYEMYYINLKFLSQYLNKVHQ